MTRRLLRAEGLSALVSAVVGYQMLDGSWAVFAVLFLVPDVAILGYMGGPRIGALAYNALHTYLGPAALAATGYLSGAHGLWPITLVWVAHIGMDRALGLGLKFPSAFEDTHLGRLRRLVRQ